MNRPAAIYFEIQQELLHLVSGYSGHAADEVKREAIGGSIKRDDALVFRRILRRRQPKTILEIGSFLGFSTRWLLEVSTPWRAHVTAVDPNIRHRIFDQPRALALQLNKTFLPDRLEIIEAFFGPPVKVPYFYWLYETYEPRLDKAAVDRLLDAKRVVDQNWPGKYDLIFIDGEHAYEAVRSNFTTALALLNPGGVIVFHDVFSHAGVNQLITEIRAEYRGGADLVIHGAWLHRCMRTRFLNRLVRSRYTDGLAEFRIKG